MSNCLFLRVLVFSIQKLPKDLCRAVLVSFRYRRDIRMAREQLQNAGSQIIETDCGPIEYATFGQGLPVLVSHGVVGGFDEGLVEARWRLGESVHSIVVSRFGYLSTAFPTDSSPAAQADAYACLLDALDIRQVPIMGISAGGTSAIQFALRYPDRCSALILISTNVPSDESLPPKVIMKILFWDPILWLIKTYFRSNMMSIVGVPKQVQTHLSPEDEKQVTELMATFFPTGLRLEGILNDIYISNPDINKGYPYQKIAVPTLMIHAIDDPMPSFAIAKSIAEKIPGATFVGLESGGHLLLGHQKIVRSDIVEFFRRHLVFELSHRDSGNGLSCCVG